MERTRRLLPLRRPSAVPAPTDADLPADQRRMFARVHEAARHVMNRKARVIRLVGDSYKQAARHESTLGQAGADLTALIRLTQAWARGSYRVVPWRSVLYSVAALLYFVNPLDAIPDVLFMIGLTDDVAIIAFVVRAIRQDLDDFVDWESGDLLDAVSEPAALPSAA